MKKEDKKVSNLKIVIIFLSLILFSFVFRVAYYIQTNDSESASILNFFSDLPLDVFADTLFTTAIIGLTYEWVIRRENERYTQSTLSNIIEESNEEQTKNIVKSIFLEPNVLRHLSFGKQDELIKSYLQVKFDDQKMGEELFNNFINKVITNPQQQFNYRKEIILEDLQDDPDKRLFRSTIDFRVRRVLKTNEFRFIFVHEDERYREFLYTHSIENVFKYNEYKFINNDNFFDYFNIKDFSINGIKLKFETTKNEGFFCIKCSHPDLNKFLGEYVNIYYRRYGLVDKLGHCYAVNIGRPTNGITIVFDYQNTNISYVTVNDFFVTHK